jgi:hypothetical protein
VIELLVKELNLVPHRPKPTWSRPDDTMIDLNTSHTLCMAIMSFDKGLVNLVKILCHSYCGNHLHLDSQLKLDSYYGVFLDEPQCLTVTVHVHVLKPEVLTIQGGS